MVLVWNILLIELDLVVGFGFLVEEVFFYDSFYVFRSIVFRGYWLEFVFELFDGLIFEVG